jgi:hypothetical protein
MTKIIKLRIEVPDEVDPDKLHTAFCDYCHGTELQHIDDNLDLVGQVIGIELVEEQPLNDGSHINVGDYETDNRDPSETWLRLDEGKTVRVDPTALFYNALENNGVDDAGLERIKTIVQEELDIGGNND